MTETELINAKILAESKLNKSDIIRLLIEDDVNSRQKKNMLESQRYYAGEHDILLKNFKKAAISETSENDQGQDKEKIVEFSNPNRSNHHNINTFHKILVEQKTSYIAGREPTISVKGAENNFSLKLYENILTDFSDEYFNEVMQDLITGASNNGFEALHVYYDNNGALKYCIIPANEIIPIYDTEYQMELNQLIRYYDVILLNNSKRQTKKKVEWWTKNDVTYFTQNEDDQFIPDTSYAYNPSPHWHESINVDNFQSRHEFHSWGRVPFILLKNNKEMTTDLQPIKGLIDAYDLISSEGTNNLIDLVALYWAIEGYGGESALAIAKKLQINKAVNISGAEGKIEAKQVDIPVSGRLEWLKMLRRDIFHFGQGIDVDAEKFGTAPSGVSLKFQYMQLELKINTMATRLKRALKDLMWFVTEDYNNKNNTNYDSTLIDITLNKSMIINDLESVQIVQMSQGIVSDKTLLANHPFISDINSEMEEIESQKKKEFQNFSESYNDLNSGDLNKKR